jgi:hypothetical protein
LVVKKMEVPALAQREEGAQRSEAVLQPKTPNHLEPAARRGRVSIHLVEPSRRVESANPAAG